ncbi:Sodium/potassium-transporting ATPase subunit alpha-1 [Tyrophagus putrescentiae]|nr:Sodium/potassium-transporting ATPase subunit alpha-1 [Tyrophagus putrescentiae]
MINEAKILHSLVVDLQLPLEHVETAFETDLQNGLEADEARERLSYQGLNVAKVKRKRRAEFYKFLGNLFGVHNAQLWFGALLCFVVYLTDNYLLEHDLEIKPDNLYIGLSLLAFVFALGVFSYYMDAKCDYYLESCRDFLTDYSVVIREGVPREVDDAQLVAGDLIFFRTGERIPADIKVVECSAVTVNEEMLNAAQRHFYRKLYFGGGGGGGGGENKKAIGSRPFNVGDLLLRDTFIDKGHGRGVVTRTRDHYLARCNLKSYLRREEEEEEEEEEEKIKLANSTPPRTSSAKVKGSKVKDRLQVNGKKKSSSLCGKSRQEVKKGPLTTELTHFLNTITALAILVAITFALWSLGNGFSLFRAVMLFIGLYIGIITQALFPTLNVAKAQIAKELASRNCYIQNINALETLGTISMIATNKTGIITENRMIVSQIWIDGQLMPSYEFMATYKGTILSEPYDSFVRVCSLNTFGIFSEDIFSEQQAEVSPFKKKAIGKPSEVALLRFMEAFTGASIELNYQRQYGKRLEAIFNCRTKCSFKIVKPEGENRLLEALVSLVRDLGRRKFRSIAVAQAYLPLDFFFFPPSGSSSSPEEDMGRFNEALIGGQLPLQLLGIVVLENPVRMSVPEAIFKCRNAGIKVMMTTADHPQTALSIAKTVGIVLGGSHSSSSSSSSSSEELHKLETSQETTQRPLLHTSASSSTSLNTKTTTTNLYTSAHLSVTSDRRLAAILASPTTDLVFARLSPEDKLRLVGLCRRLPRSIAVTGIGAADLPVYERASVRIALGQYGADICKANCDVVLLDDNFASIVHGIEEGRVLFDNMKKSLCYTLSSKPVEVLPYVLAFTVGMPKMASSITIMAIDLVADNFPPIALGYEGAEGHVMLERPRYLRKERVVSCDTIIMSLCFYGAIQFLGGTFACFVVMAQMGFHPRSLFFIAPKWYSAAVNDYEDDYGQEWTYQQRSELEFTCHTIYFITVVLCRIAVLYSCRTRRDSILGQIFRNTMINFSVFFLLFACAFLSYYPIFQYLVQMYPIKLPWWLISAPYFVLILVLEELRKLVIRRVPTVKRNFFPVHTCSVKAISFSLAIATTGRLKSIRLLSLLTVIS